MAIVKGAGLVMKAIIEVSLSVHLVVYSVYSIMLVVFSVHQSVDLHLINHLKNMRQHQIHFV